jgi:Zn-finger protein
MLDNNAELYFKVLVTRLEEMGMDDIVAKYRSMAKTKNNPDFFTLFPRLLREYVDKLLESEYKIARDTHRAASVTRICGVVMYMCGVWDSQSITALNGGVVNKETLVHDSNIINKLLEMFSKEREGVQRELVKLIKNAEIKQPNKEMTDNNTMGLNEVKKEMFEQILMTPDKLANMLDLKVIDDNKPSDEETIQENKEKFYEMVQRMNNTFKNQ